MYRIRTINPDGTLGNFYSDQGLVANPSQSNVYQEYDELLKDHISKAFFLSGGVRRPVVNYNINTLTQANDEKSAHDNYVNRLTFQSNKTDPNQASVDSPRYLPPFEDKPSRGAVEGEQRSVSIGYFEIDGGYLENQQDLDLDGGYA